MHQPNIAVPSPPSVIRVALIWLSLSVASLAGFASASPQVTSATASVSSSTLESLGAQSGLVAAGLMVVPTLELPARTAQWADLVALHFEPSDVDLALRVMHCESSGHPEAINRASGASGLYQHLPRFWDERSALAGVHQSIFDAEANITVAAWLVYEGGGWRHWEASRLCWSQRSALR